MRIISACVLATLCFLQTPVAQVSNCWASFTAVFYLNTLLTYWFAELSSYSSLAFLLAFRCHKSLKYSGKKHLPIFCFSCHRCVM